MLVGWMTVTTARARVRARVRLGLGLGRTFARQLAADGRSGRREPRAHAHLHLAHAHAQLLRLVEQGEPRRAERARRARSRRADQGEGHMRVGRQVAVLCVEADPLVPPQARARGVAGALRQPEWPAVRVQLAADVQVARGDVLDARDALGVAEAGLVAQQRGTGAMQVEQEELDLQVDVAREEVRVQAPRLRHGRAAL